MSNEWAWPSNDAKTLWIQNAESHRSLGHLLSDIQDHFGSDATLAEFDIEHERFEHYRAPCGCCRSDDIYGEFFKITRRETPCPDTKALLLSDTHRY